MKFILFLSLFLSATSHDVQVAFYKIYKVKQQVVVDFVFEKEDVFQILNLSETSLTNEALQSYLRNNFSMKINGASAYLEYHELSIKGKHLHLSGSVKEKVKKIKTLEIDNLCLLEIADHSNIIELKLSRKQRDFLMNKERTNILVNY